VRQQERAAAANYASLLGIFLSALHPVIGQAAIAAAMGQQLKYQRDFEREADFLGIEYARKAGYDPGAMLHLLRKIYDEQKINPTLIPPYFQSHPLSGERMAYLEASLGTSEWDVAKSRKSWRLERAQAIVRGYAQTRREAVPPYEHRLAKASAEERPEALELIGILMVHGEEYETGRKYLEQAEAAGRNVDRELGRAYLRAGKPEEARKRLERRVAAAPEDYDALADLGEAYFQQGDYERSVGKLQGSVDLYSYLPAVQRSLGRALDKTGKTGAGFYHFARASELEGQGMTALEYYGKALERLDENDPLRPKARERVEALEKEKPRLPVPPGMPGGGRRMLPSRAADAAR
jgi:predicted Zn-dependent protease